MIELAGVDKAFGKRLVIDAITLTIMPGAVTALLGSNGAGKTTLLRLIAGLDRPDRGTVAVCGRAGVHLGPGAMDPRHTVWQHLRWLAVLGNVTSTRAEAVLAESGLMSRRSARIVELSTGWRQRLAIAGALLSDPSVLILDEPINGLDVAGVVWLRTLLRRLAKEGKTVVASSHALSEVLLSADRVVILDGGQVTAAGALFDLIPPGVDPRHWLEQTLCVSPGR